MLIALKQTCLHMSVALKAITPRSLQGLFKKISNDCTVFLLLARQGFIEYYFRKKFLANVLNK